MSRSEFMDGLKKEIYPFNPGGVGGRAKLNVSAFSFLQQEKENISPYGRSIYPLLVRKRKGL